MKKYILISLTLMTILFSCKNDSWSFNDYDYSTVYFAYQYPIRKIVLGEDIYDNSLDNEHKCKIMATTGGVYTNKRNIILNYEVDETLCSNLYYSTGEKILPMPQSYYELSDNKIIIKKGDIMGGVEVQLKDDFFSDPLALECNYVIPLVITDVQNADSILSGNPLVDNPNRCVSSDWSVVPKDYILYGLKYINTWHANYLRRGEDVLTFLDGTRYINKRRASFVEQDEVCSLSTVNLSTVKFPIAVKKPNSEVEFLVNLSLTFNEEGTCVISSEDYSVLGTGKFVVKGDKNSWGNEDRDVLYLDYTIEFDGLSCETKDTLVVRDRGTNKLETFIPKKI